MNYRPLGNTGLRVSEIGFGTWGLGGDGGGAVAYGSTDDDTSRFALRSAFDLGINFYDTSDLYGFGHSEELLGEVFGSCRDKVIIASKVGFVAGGKQDFSAAHIRAALEQSLRRLRTDYLDLYQLHSPSLTDLREQAEIIPLLDELRAAGKIRAWGLSARSPEDARIAAEEFNPPCLQVNFNLTDQRALQNGLFDLCCQRQIGVIVRTPLCFGFLTGKYSGAQSFDPFDHRSRWSPEQLQRWSQANAAFQFLFAANPSDTPAQLALRFCLSFDAVATTIPGMLNNPHVLENAAASGRGALSAEQVRRAIVIGANTEFFVRPA
ncbi:MAG: aldo/keto reductase [Verrucomicrobia bacterium]|nr:aldo/keto reductase [Verrucomicrobiota bacterium]